MNINIGSNIFKQRMKYLIVWMIHYYYSNRHKLKTDNDNDDGSDYIY